jgi:hypothetical protein
MKKDKFALANDKVIRNRLQSGIFNYLLETNNKPLVISDFDDCIMSIAPFWIMQVLKKQGKEISLDEAIKLAAERKEYYIHEHLGVPANELHSVYLNREFYESDLIFLSKIGISLFNCLKYNKCDLVIISSTFDCHKEVKKEICKKIFPKAKLVFVSPTGKKSKAINDLGLGHYSTFIDDKIENIQDVLENTFSVGKEFICPKFGYNKASDELLQKFNEEDAVLYYSDF